MAANRLGILRNDAVNRMPQAVVHRIGSEFINRVAITDCGFVGHALGVYIAATVSFDAKGLNRPTDRGLAAGDGWVTLQLCFGQVARQLRAASHGRHIKPLLDVFAHLDAKVAQDFLVFHVSMVAKTLLLGL